MTYVTADTSRQM